MNSRNPFRDFSATAVMCMALFSMPALAVVQQTLEFPTGQSVQRGTLTLDSNPDTPYEGEVVQDENGDSVLIFVLPDDADGTNATVDYTVDGRDGSISFPVGATPTVSVIPAFEFIRRNPGFDIGFSVDLNYFGTDVATTLAQRSASDATIGFTDLGLANIMAGSNADDTATGWGGSLRFGYHFADDSALTFSVGAARMGDFSLGADASGDLPGTSSVATFNSIGTVELDVITAEIGYSRFFTPSSNWGYFLTVGNQWIDRSASFTSTLALDGVVTDSFSGGDSLDGTALLLGGGILWKPQTGNAKFRPEIRFGFTQSDDEAALEESHLRRLMLSLAF